MPLPPIPTKWIVLIRRMRSLRSVALRSGCCPVEEMAEGGAAEAVCELRPSTRLAHRLDEGASVSAHAGPDITLASRLNPAFACLMSNIEGHRAGEFCQRERYDSIELSRAQTAADDEN